MKSAHLPFAKREYQDANDDGRGCHGIVEKPSMNTELLRQRQDVVALLQALDRHSAEFIRPPTHS